MNKFKTIGVLGGIGAAASADFYKQIVDITQQTYHAEQDDDFPPIFIYNLPLVGFGEAGFVDPESVKVQLIDGVKKLERAEVDFIVIPCNTVHYFLSDLQASIKVPILSILEVAADAVQKENFKKIGLLNSASTKQYKLYESIFEKRGIETLSSTDDEQLNINSVVGRVMAGKQDAKDIITLQAIINRYASEGAEAIVLGCTEMPLAISQKDCSLPLLSTTTLLAEAALIYAYKPI